LNTPVTKLTQIADGWRVTTASGEAEHSAVIYCGTAHRLAELEIVGTPASGPACTGSISEPGRRPALQSLSEIRHPPVASVVLGFRREDVTHPCAGFGMLIPKVEGFKILGAIFSSSLFPGRAPAGYVLLSCYVGGERQPELASLPPEKLVELAGEDLRVLLGVQGRPVFTHHHFWPRAIPQYNVGHGRFKELMTAMEARAPGLFFAGHYRDGVSLGDSIVSGGNIAERVGKLFETTNKHGAGRHAAVREASAAPRSN
jgi:oxygen-dependent protoporphyrinogen oxidase